MRKEHPYVALSYNNIGTINNNIGNYDKALEAHRKALDIRLNILGEKHPVVAISYNNIGEIYDQKKIATRLLNILKMLCEVWIAYNGVTLL